MTDRGESHQSVNISVGCYTIQVTAFRVLQPVLTDCTASASHRGDVATGVVALVITWEPRGEHVWTMNMFWLVAVLDQGCRCGLCFIAGSSRRQLAMAIGADHVYGAMHGMDTITLWPRLAGDSPYFRGQQPAEGAVQHKIRERRGMGTAQRCLDNLFLARDNPRLLLACRISEEAGAKRLRHRLWARKWRQAKTSPAARQQQLGGLQLLAIEDTSPTP